MSTTNNPNPAQPTQTPSSSAAANPFIRVPIPLAELEAAFDGALPPDPDAAPDPSTTTDATGASSTADPVQHDEKKKKKRQSWFSRLSGSSKPKAPPTETHKSIRMLRAEYYTHFVKNEGEPEADSKARRQSPEAREILRTRYLDGDAEGRRDMTGRHDHMAASAVGGVLNSWS